MSKTGFDILLRKVGPKIERKARIVAEPVAKERKSKQSLAAYRRLNWTACCRFHVLPTSVHRRCPLFSIAMETCILSAVISRFFSNNVHRLTVESCLWAVVCQCRRGWRRKGTRPLEGKTIASCSRESLATNAIECNSR